MIGFLSTFYISCLVPFSACHFTFSYLKLYIFPVIGIPTLTCKQWLELIGLVRQTRLNSAEANILLVFECCKFMDVIITLAILQVMIFRLIARGTIEERMMQMTKKKMVLEHLVVGRLKTQNINQVRFCLKFTEAGLNIFCIHFLTCSWTIPEK